VSGDKPFTVDDAYSLETPEDSLRLYGNWAATYDEDFVAGTGYVAHFHVADRLLRHRGQIGGPVLDVGCGTGVVGVCLREGGIGAVDGIDISRAMLDQAGSKRTGGGEPVYRELIAADLTKPLDIPDHRYAALVSAGTFTHGHLGPAALHALWRVAAPGAWCAIGIRTTHYEAAGFGDAIRADVAAGTISEPVLEEVPVYAPELAAPEHANDRVYVLVCRVLQ